MGGLADSPMRAPLWLASEREAGRGSEREARRGSRLRSAARALSPGPLRSATLGMLRSYAQVLLGHNGLAGLLFLAATLVVPAHGLAGLVGMAACNLWARLLGRPAAHIADGSYGVNGLLVGLALGLYFQVTAAFLVLLAVVSLLTVVVTAAMRNLSDRYLGVPVLSLPFTVVTWTALLATRRFAGVEVTLGPVLVTDWGSGVLPATLELYVRSLGACFFQLSVVSGALVLVGLLWSSRWAVLLSALGFASGYAVYVGLGGTATDLTAQFVGLNFVLTAVAVGGIFLVLRPASMVLAAASGALAAVVAAAMLALLEPFGLPVLAAPFIVTTQLVLFALLIGSRSGGLRLVQGAPSTPERNLVRAAFRERRYADPSLPVFFLPVMGRWTVTQGFDGEHTHQGLWSHAWDFEVDDGHGQRYRDQGTRLEDYLAYRAPVVAPADGRVMRVVSHLEDNPVGEVDTTHNWGNLVILWHHGDVYSALCHLQKGSVPVREGETVTRGQLIGRVGNSGRSPVPHLHFHVQASPEVGAPTRHAELLHYVATTAEGRRYVTHGVPATGDRVEAMQVDDRVRRAVTLAPGRELVWRIDDRRRGEREEIWRSEIDALGERRLVADGGRAAAGFYADDHYATLLDYEGRADALLGLFYLGATRIPYLDDPTAPWEDHPAATAFVPAPVRVVQELLLPFAPVGALTTRSELRSNGGSVVTTQITARGAARVPDRVEVTFAAGLGPVGLRAWRGGEEVLTARVAP